MQVYSFASIDNNLLLLMAEILKTNCSNLQQLALLLIYINKTQLTTFQMICYQQRLLAEVTWFFNIFKTLGVVTTCQCLQANTFPNSEFLIFQAPSLSITLMNCTSAFNIVIRALIALVMGSFTAWVQVSLRNEYEIFKVIMLYVPSRWLVVLPSLSHHLKQFSLSSSDVTSRFFDS